VAAGRELELLHETHGGGYLVSGYLQGSCRTLDVPRTEILRSIEHSLAFGLYYGGGQIGFARAVTYYARFAYLANVFVLEEHRGRGLGRWLVGCVLDHPDLREVHEWMLATRDAHGCTGASGLRR
jgi:GNAT superfamily N-acetyltransferase